jgi:membrane-bound hydrogenase subunit beta
VIKEYVTQYGKAVMDGPALADALKEKFKDVQSIEIHERIAGAANGAHGHDLWLEIPRESFRPFVEHLFSYDFVNFHIISGDDVEEDVALSYHLSLFQRDREGRVGVTVTVKVPKSDLSMPSLFDVLPGSEYSERETREMFGVDFVGLPNKALVFLPEDWNEQIKPWRRDSEGPTPEIIRELN